MKKKKGCKINNRLRCMLAIFGKSPLPLPYPSKGNFPKEVYS